jgi:hypothetical protein
MKLRLFTSLIALFTILAFGGSLHAGSTIFQVTDNFYEDSLPQIKGDYVVWQGKVDGDWEVFVCSINTPEAPIQITDNGYDDIFPKTDGNYVVWLGHTRAGGEIFLYNIGSGTTTQVTDNDNVDSHPQIADGRVVWESQEVTESVEPGEIMLYDISTGVTEQLTDDTLDDSDPQINSETVFWVKTNEDDSRTSFIHDIAAGVTSEAPEGYVWGDSPQTDGGLTVLTRHDGDDREIFLRNSDSKRYHQITDNDLEDTYPSISGNNMAWMADEEIYIGEYEYLGLISPGDNTGLPSSPPGTFTWEGIGYNQFKVEFSGYSGFPASDSLVFPSTESWMSETSITLSEASWGTIRTIEETNGVIYWRVEGMDAEGGVSYSETWSFTIHDGADIYTAFTNEDTNTDNGGGGGGPCFIGTLSFDSN